MGYYYLKDKIEEIRAKDISDEEKIKEIKKLVEGIQTRRKESTKKQERQTIALFFIIIAILVLSAIFMSLHIDLRCYLYYGAFLLAGIVAFIYRVYKKIKLTKKENHWKNVMKQETVNLQNLCEDLCNNINIDLKRKKNKIVLSKLVFGIGIVLPLCILFYLILEHNDYLAEAISYILIFSFMYAILVTVLMDNVREVKKEYKALYKKEVISSFVKSVSSNMEYSEAEPDKSKLKVDYSYIGFDIAYELRLRINVEDYCTGNIDGINMEMADIVSYVHYGGKGNYEKILFTGNFMVLDTNKKYEKFEIRLNKFKLFNKREFIEVDNQNFNKYFKVYANNNVNTQEYLTSYLIDFLTDFREKYGIDFEMIFEDKIYIRFYTDNMFEPKMKGKIVDEYSVYKFYVITKFAREFVEKFERYGGQA